MDNCYELQKKPRKEEKKEKQICISEVEIVKKNTELFIQNKRFRLLV